MTWIIISSFFGGAVRGWMGFIKHQYSYKNVKFSWKYFFGTLLASGLAGFACSLAVKELGLALGGGFSPALGFVIGYGGGDFIESLYQIIIKKSSLFKE